MGLGLGRGRVWGGVRVRAREWGGVRARGRARGGVRKEGWEIVRGGVRVGLGLGLGIGWVGSKWVGVRGE